jgi:hypothetical protein
LDALADSLTSKYRSLLVDVGLVFAAAYPDALAASLLADPTRFCRIICTLSPRLLFALVPAFSSFPSRRKEIFDPLVSFIDAVGSDKERISQYFRMVSVVFHDSCDPESSVRFCLSLFIAAFRGHCKIPVDNSRPPSIAMRRAARPLRQSSAVFLQLQAT